MEPWVTTAAPMIADHFQIIGADGELAAVQAVDAVDVQGVGADVSRCVRPR